MFVSKLEIHIFNLEMCISNLKMKNQTALSCFFSHFGYLSGASAVIANGFLQLSEYGWAFISFLYSGKIITFVAVEQFRLFLKQ